MTLIGQMKPDGNHFSHGVIHVIITIDILSV